MNETMVRIPEHITEAEVLALIENDMGSIPVERRDVVRAAVAADPALARFVAESRQDSGTIVSMSRAAAPSDLRARVIEDLCRPIPRLDVIREPEGGAIPVSTVLVRRESAWRRFAERVPVHKLAMAAMLLLGAGVGVMLIRNGSRVPEGPALPGPVAMTETHDDPSLLAPLPPLVDPTSDRAVAVKADEAEDFMTLPAERVDETGLPISVAADAPAAPLEPVATPAPAGMPIARAIELARAGRLAIRVRAMDEAGVKSAMERLAFTAGDDVKWRPLQAWELTEVAAALRGVPRAPAAYAADKPIGPTGAPKAAERDVPAPVVEPIGIAADVAEALRGTSARPLYNVELDETEEDLAALLERLASDKARRVEFVELERALPTLTPSTDPAAVLWWTRPPSGWTRRVSVPIVLDEER